MDSIELKVKVLTINNSLILYVNGNVLLNDDKAE